MSSFIVGYKQVFFVIKSEAYCILRNICSNKINLFLYFAETVKLATTSQRSCNLRNCILWNKNRTKL